MRAFAVIQKQPVRYKKCTVSFDQQIQAKLVVDALKPAIPHKNLQNQVHVIDMKKTTPRISEQSPHIINSQSPHPQTPQIHMQPAQQEPIQQTVNPKLQGGRKKPIFEKSTAPRQVRPDDETISSISTIKINSSREDLEEEQQIYFASAGHRKMKGQDKPYAQTYRTKEYQQIIKEKHKKQEQTQIKPVRRKLFSHQKANPQSIEKTESLQNSKKAFKKKPIFLHNQKNNLVESNLVYEQPVEQIKKVQEVENQNEEKSSNISNNDSSRIIKLHPKQSRKSIKQSQNSIKEGRDGQSSRIIKLQGKESKKSLGNSISGSNNMESQLSISVISRKPMSPFML